MLDVWIFIAICVCTVIVLALMKEDSIVQIIFLIGSVAISWFLAWQLNSALIVLVGALVGGLIVRKYSYDELKIGRKWFIVVEVASIVGAIVSFFVDESLSYGFAFVALVALPSLAPISWNRYFHV